MHLRTRRSLSLALGTAIVAVTCSPVAVAAAPTAASCDARALTLRIESGDGRFAGMSNDGAIVVVRNVGNATCSISALPTLTLRDARGRNVATGVPTGARFMHPGPVVLPITLDAGETAAATLRWISGNVFDASARHATSARLALMLDDAATTAPLIATVWAHSGVAITFDEGHLTKALPPLDDASIAMAGTYVGEGPDGSTYVDALGHPARKLIIRKEADGRAAFTFDGIGGQAPNLGSIAGPLVVQGERATFHDPTRDCDLTFAFYGVQLTVVQTGACGFGNAVSARGQYRAI